MGDEAEELLQHRFAINNVWRPIAGPLLRSPSALCDAETLETENLVASEPRHPDRIGETDAHHLQSEPAPAPFPKMQRDEAAPDPLLHLSAFGPGALSRRTVRSTIRRRPMTRRRGRASRFGRWSFY